MVQPVRTRREFSALSSSRTRGRSGPVWVVRADGPDPGPVPEVRVAYAVGRPVGSAVVRNRVRRRLRALIDDRDRTGALRPGSYLVGTTPGAVGASFEDLGRHLDGALGGLRTTPHGS